MTKYKVSWNEHITCYADVEADSKEQAQEKAMKLPYSKISIDLIERIGEVDVE